MLKVLLVPAELIDPVDTLSPNTRRRCLAAMEAWNIGGYDFVLMTGGLFLEPARQTRSAAETMSLWFRLKFVPEERMLLEERSVDTYENIANSLGLLRERGLGGAEITVVTQLQHAIRFKITCWRAHGVRIRTIVVRQPEMSWKDWLLEWFVLIPIHILDRSGTGFISRWNKTKRRLAAGLT